MKPIATMSLLAAGVGAAVLGSNVYAYAAWTTTSPATVLSVTAASVPAGPRPSAVARGHRVDLSWARTDISPGVPAQRYLVRRHGPGQPIIVCTARKTTCHDTEVPPGEWTYTVRLLLQTWEGDDGPPSAPVTVTSEINTAGGTGEAGNREGHARRPEPARPGPVDSRDEQESEPTDEPSPAAANDEVTLDGGNEDAATDGREDRRSTS